MTHVALPLTPSRCLQSLQRTLTSALRQRRASAATTHLDDRLRADVGLPPRGERPLRPHEAAARATMLTWR